jgi:hypothetical protein
MTYSSGGLIQATDYNGFVSTTAGANVNATWGQGTGNAGWGQNSLATVSAGGTVTATQWASLVNTLSAMGSQTGTTITVRTAPTTGQTISVLAAVNTDLTNCYTNRGNASASGTQYGTFSGTTSKTTATGTGNATWTITFTHTVTFPSADQARYFWNGGGRVRISSSRTGGAVSAQNASWSSLLSSAGTQEFGGSAVYGWGTTTVQLYSISSSAPYASNTYQIRGGTNIDNSAGGATNYVFLLIWQDPYVDPMPGAPPLPEDIVDGTLSYSVEVTYPTGGHALTPSGTWTSYTYSSYTAGAITGG